MNPYNAAVGGGGAANPFGTPGYVQPQQSSMGYGYEEQPTAGYDQGGGAGIGFGQQQAPGYGPPGARPRVDVEASGEVDPNL